MLFNHLILCCPFSFCLQSFPASGSFPRSQFSTSGSQSTGASALALVLPVNIQDWFPLRLTDLISSLSKGFSRVFSNTTVQKHQFLGAQPSSWPNSHIWTWLLDYMVIPLLKLLCWPPSEFLHWPTRPCGSGSSCLSGLICSVPPSPVLLQSHQALLLSFLGTDMFLPQGLSTCCFMVWNALPLVIHVDSFLTSLRSLLKYLSESPFFTTLFKITMSF